MMLREAEEAEAEAEAEVTTTAVVIAVAKPPAEAWISQHGDFLYNGGGTWPGPGELFFSHQLI